MSIANGTYIFLYRDNVKILVIIYKWKLLLNSSIPIGKWDIIR